MTIFANRTDVAGGFHCLPDAKYNSRGPVPPDGRAVQRIKGGAEVFRYFRKGRICVKWGRPR